MLKTITVTLIMMKKSGEDPFGAPVTEEVREDIPGVLVAPASSDDVVSSLQLYGKKAVYNLAVPKGDTHEWKDAKVEFFGQTWRTFGFPTEGIEENIPLRWNRKVMVEAYE